MPTAEVESRFSRPMPRPTSIPRSTRKHAGPSAPRLDPAPPDADPQNPSAELLLWGYRHAIFPMADPDRNVIEWFMPDPRGIVPLSPATGFRVQKNLAREVRKRRFDVRADSAFERMMRECATDRSATNRTWMNDRLLRSYLDLHKIGHAHSIEAWLDDELVGGLYGVHIGGAFFGESMFSRPERGGTNASKVCLVHLVRWLRHRKFKLLDTQFRTPHLAQFGCVEVSARKYKTMLARAIAAKVAWGEFNSESDAR